MEYNRTPPAIFALEKSLQGEAISAALKTLQTAVNAGHSIATSKRLAQSTYRAYLNSFSIQWTVRQRGANGMLQPPRPPSQ